jgi:nucleoside-diphosphate-sugar epimerase
MMGACDGRIELQGTLSLRKNFKILVAGAGGFIGGALLSILRKQGNRDLRGVDIKRTAGFTTSAWPGNAAKQAWFGNHHC